MFGWVFFLVMLLCVMLLNVSDCSSFLFSGLVLYGEFWMWVCDVGCCLDWFGLFWVLLVFCVWVFWKMLIYVFCVLFVILCFVEWMLFIIKCLFMWDGKSGSRFVCWLRVCLSVLVILMLLMRFIEFWFMVVLSRLWFLLM